MTEDSAVKSFRHAEKAYLESFGLVATQHVVQLDRLGIEARFQTVGDGPPLVFVHGGGGVGSEWAPLLPHLSGYRALLLDRPGFGLTDFVDYKGVDFRAHAEDFLADIFDAAGVESAPMVGHSMGALWSLWFARREPAPVESLILMGCPAFILGTSAPGGMRLMGIPGLKRLMMSMEPPSPEQVRTLWRRLGHDPDADLSPHMVELMYRHERLPNYGVAWRSLLERVLPWSRADRRLAFGESDLQKVGQDLLYIWGSNDPFGSLEIAQKAQRATPNSHLHVVGTGHLPWVDEPDTCAELTATFLAHAGDKPGHTGIDRDRAG